VPDVVVRDGSLVGRGDTGAVGRGGCEVVVPRTGGSEAGVGRDVDDGGLCEGAGVRPIVPVTAAAVPLTASAATAPTMTSRPRRPCGPGLPRLPRLIVRVDPDGTSRASKAAT
jgi:hypothetical protein